MTPVLSLFSLSLLTPLNANAQSASIAVETAALPAIAAPGAGAVSTFTRITFTTPFANGSTPNVFPMTPEFGAGGDDDPCTIRIRNIDNLGFDAACLEAINEDRGAPAVSFDYIAINDGVTAVPLVGGGTTQFESACSDVDNQVFGPNCSNCALASGQTQGYQTVNFTSAFATPPALLTQIASTNNILASPAGEPESLVAAVQTNTLSTTGFNVSLDRMEAGNGVISNPEQVCHLAVARNGCQELDLSTLGGPPSVFFNAVHGGNVDGHSNGATTGEGASFAAGCFTATPVVNLAVKRGLNGRPILKFFI